MEVVKEINEDQDSPLKMPNWFYNKHTFDQSSEKKSQDEVDEETTTIMNDNSNNENKEDAVKQTEFVPEIAEEIQNKPKRVQKTLVIRSKSKSGTK